MSIDYNNIPGKTLNHQLEFWKHGTLIIVLVAMNMAIANKRHHIFWNCPVAMLLKHFVLWGYGELLLWMHV